MNLAIEVSLSILAWLVTLIRLPSIVRHQAWRADRTAFQIWVATFSFAWTMTFLLTPFSEALNRLTWHNLSRLLAYICVSLTLHLTASAFMVTFPTPQNKRQHRYLLPYLLVTQAVLVIIFAGFVSHTPTWDEGPIPKTLAETAFKLVIFSYATALCTIMAMACYRYLHQEKVVVTKFRIIAIILTASSGAVYFLTKFVLTLGYFWSPLGADWIFTLSKMLLVATAMLWGSSFLHNNVYAHVLALLRGVRYWLVYRDLAFLVEQLDRVCLPVAIEEQSPDFRRFISDSEYYLYRASIRILDGKTMLEDYLDRENQAELPEDWPKWDIKEASQINRILSSVYTAGDFWETINSFRSASRQLFHCRQQSYQEAVS